MKTSKGQHVLVTACGPGTDVLAIAQIVGPSGRIVGFDLDKHSIGQAREALEKQPDLEPYVQFHVADVHDLSMFAGQTFDAIHCNASYHWFTNKPLFLAQAATVAKPGTVIGIATQDRTFQPPLLDIRTEVLAELGEDATNFVFHPTPAELQRDLSTAGFGDAKLLGYYGTWRFRRYSYENLQIVARTKDAVGVGKGPVLGEKGVNVPACILEAFTCTYLDKVKVEGEDGEAVIRWRKISCAISLQVYVSRGLLVFSNPQYDGWLRQSPSYVYTTVAFFNGQLIPLSAAPVFPSPAQLYNPTGLFCVALKYCKSIHCWVPVLAARAIRPSAMAFHVCCSLPATHSRT
ncbi:hypothetical protein ACET3X_003512 [Alternaria dauci]|uniref:Methyltransferase domain-containing protein n=1 Tax=Alternaria dauci TaxID=48095 RepID=A0ABR3UTR9_9PLEO